MRRFIQIAAIAVFTVTIAVPAFAQQQRGQRRQGASAAQQTRRQGAVPQQRAKARAQQAQQRFRQLDKDNNGTIGRAEWPRNERVFDRLDRNQDGQLTAAELKRAQNRRARRSR